VEIPRLKATTAAPPTTGGGGFARLEKYRHTDGTLAPVMADTAHIAGWGSAPTAGMTSAITGALPGRPPTQDNFGKRRRRTEHHATVGTTHYIPQLRQGSRMDRPQRRPHGRNPRPGGAGDQPRQRFGGSNGGQCPRQCKHATLYRPPVRGARHPILHHHRLYI